MNKAHIYKSAQSALVASVLMLTLAMSAFFTFEPSVGRAITDNFTVTQTITDEISFSTFAADVAMDGGIQGLTGGFATGTTVAVVRSNDAQGYTMTLHFATSTSGHAMQASSTAYINDYTPATPGTPDFLWVDKKRSAHFEHTVLVKKDKAEILTIGN